MSLLFCTALLLAHSSNSFTASCINTLYHTHTNGCLHSLPYCLHKDVCVVCGMKVVAECAVFSARTSCLLAEATEAWRICLHSIPRPPSHSDTHQTQTLDRSCLAEWRRVDKSHYSSVCVSYAVCCYILWDKSMSISIETAYEVISDVIKSWWIMRLLTWMFNVYLFTFWRSGKLAPFWLAVAQKVEWVIH